ncbi:MAG: hypothetical protein K2X81_10090 [Candidatus Obscuribacterales bacterium]|nr:hypothetical protein [Candidatus Obscuribacterales bacterium]
MWPQVTEKQVPPGVRDGVADHIIYDNPSQAVIDRIEELRDQIPEPQRDYITLAVGAARENPVDNRYYVLGTSEPKGYLRHGVKPKLYEIVVCCKTKAHAEITVIAFVVQENWILLTIGATRPICNDCRDAIQHVGAEPVTPLRP